MLKKTRLFNLHVIRSYPFSRYVLSITVNLENDLSGQRVLQPVQVLSLGHDSPGGIDGIITKLVFEVVIVSNFYF
jgi:hypothetical protein